MSHTIRCVVIGNDSPADIKYEVFERLNSSTVPLNAQELRNSLYRSLFNDRIREMTKGKRWLSILGRKQPDKRMRDAELILRFYAFTYVDFETYRTPMKHWLNDAAKSGRSLTFEQVDEFESRWNHSIANCLTWFEPTECFRKPESKAVNRGVFDLLASTAWRAERAKAERIREPLRKAYFELFKDEEYIDVVSRSVDHKKRTKRRFEIWNERVLPVIVDG